MPQHYTRLLRLAALLTLLFGLVQPRTAAAQDGLPPNVRMVKDINQQFILDNPREFYEVGKSILVPASDDIHGMELWKIGPDFTSISLLTDLWPGVDSGLTGWTYATYEDALFFSGRDGEGHQGLWSSDGSAAGTRYIPVTLPEGDTLTIDEISSASIGPANTRLFFIATTITWGRELWVSDGTGAGTHLVKDILPGSSGAVDKLLGGWNNSLYFVSADGEGHGYELWRTDGTEAGTTLVKDIYPGSASSEIFYPLPVRSNGLFFIADDGVHGAELWRTDGSEAGTQLFLDIKPGSADGELYYLTPTRSGQFAFTASDGVHGVEVWVSDGTVAGTKMLLDIYPGSNGSHPSTLRYANNLLYIAAREPVYGREIYVSQLTAATTTRITDFVPGSSDSSPFGFTYYAGKVYGRISTPETGDELFETDGTPTGTRIIKEFQPGTDGSWPNDLNVIGDRLFFKTWAPGSIQEIWSFDSASGEFLQAQPAASVYGSGMPLKLTPLAGSRVVFTAYTPETGRELWVSDGTDPGTFLLRDVYPGPETGVVNYYSNYMVSLGNQVLFRGDNPETGSELWRTDGTVEGTLLVKDLIPGAHNNDNVMDLTAVLTAAGARAFFRTNTGALWVSDGSEAGTSELAGFYAGTSACHTSFTAGPGLLYFSGCDTMQQDAEVWVSDGTPAGTRLVKNIGPGTTASYPEKFMAGDTLMYFVANDGASGRELWVTDGSEVGTHLVRDINPGSEDGYVTPLKTVGDTLYFQATDPAAGNEIWKTDGTEAGTVMVTAMDQGTAPRAFHWLACGDAACSWLYFTGADQAHGMELWRTTGIPGEVELVSDIRPGTADGFPVNTTLLNGQAYFIAEDEEHGWAIWRSDGSADGTTFFADLNPTRPGYITTSIFYPIGQTLFFTDNDGTNGYELYRLDPLLFTYVPIVGK